MQFRQLLSGEEMVKATSRPARANQTKLAKQNTAVGSPAFFPHPSGIFITSIFPVAIKCRTYSFHQGSQETAPVVKDSDSDLDEEAALAFYRNIEKQLRLKRKSKSEDTEE